MRDATRDRPRALLTALLFETVAYALAQPLVAGTLSAAISERPVGQAAMVLGPAGAIFVTLGVLLATSGYIGESILASSRITFAIAERDRLPSSGMRRSALPKFSLS